MTVPDGFTVVRKVVRGVVVICNACGKVTQTRWGMAKRHAEKHATPLSPPDATPGVEPGVDAPI